MDCPKPSDPATRRTPQSRGRELSVPAEIQGSSSSSPSSFLLLLDAKILLKFIEAFVPEALIAMYPPGNLAKRFPSKRYVNFTPLLPALNQAGPFEQLQVFRHRI